MNKKGFTLVEVLAVIVLLAIVISVSVPLISNSGKNGKIKVLEAKVENIKKAAVVFAQNNNITFSSSSCSSSSYSFNPCSGVTVGSCECAVLPIYYDNNGTPDSISSVTVGNLLNLKMIEPDDKSTGLVNNPVDETKSLNNCTLTLYKKYDKIYAIYDKEGTNDETCWYK